ncbi:MAG TPA: hypothetical protein VM581_02015 [Magnetospirillaceae bacterium]|nr:hypothetical protein [Magnetospirillaceae bacterium]
MSLDGKDREVLNHLRDAIQILTSDLHEAGSLDAKNPIKTATQILGLKTVTLSYDILRNWETLDFDTLAIIQRAIIETAADCCLIVCGKHGDKWSNNFIQFHDHAKKILSNFLEESDYGLTGPKRQDWCDQHSKVSRVAGLHKKHHTIQGHDYRKNYELLSLFVHTAPMLETHANRGSRQLLYCAITAPFAIGVLTTLKETIAKRINTSYLCCGGFLATGYISIPIVCVGNVGYNSGA